MELMRKPWFVGILSSAVTILFFHMFYNMKYAEIGVTKLGSSAVNYNSGRGKTQKEYSARNCALFTQPKKFIDRTPQILQTGRVRLADYNTFPDDQSIECIPHHAAVSPCKICIIETKKDSIISGQLKTQQGWEPVITGAFKRALAECEDCEVLDFGSNLGVYALIGASANRKVFAVEPMHENLVHLVKSVRVNNWQDRVKIITNTLSNVYEEMEFWRPWSNAGGSIAKKVGHPAPDRKLYDGPYDRVSSVQIDNLLEVIDFKKAVMKIDIEGYEPKAFSGASRFLAQVDIPYIFMEWSNKAKDQEALKMATDLYKLGYDVHDPSMNKLAPPNANTVGSYPFDIIWKKTR